MIEHLMSAGAPGWLIVLLVVLGVGVPAATGEKAATIPGLIGSTARWWQSRKSRRREEARAEAEAAAQLTASERVSDKEIARLEGLYDKLARRCAEDSARADTRAAELTEDVDDLRRQVEKLEREVTATKARFFLLLGYTRKVMDVVRKLDADHPLPPVPVELQEWLGHG